MSLIDVLHAEATLLLNRDEDEHAPLLLRRAATRIRELEQQLAASNASCESLRASAVSLSKDVAAHERVCAGAWVKCSERLPTRGNCKTRGVHKVTRLLVEQNTNSTWVKDGKVLWFVQPESVEWEEWLDAKQPDEGVKS